MSHKFCTLNDETIYLFALKFYVDKSFIAVNICINNTIMRPPSLQTSSGNVWVATRHKLQLVAGGDRKKDISTFCWPHLANDNSTWYKKCLISHRFTICNLAKCLLWLRNYRLIHIIQSSSSAPTPTHSHSSMGHKDSHIKRSMLY